MAQTRYRQGVDVTDKVRQLVASGKDAIPVNTQMLLGQDVYPGALKQLKVTFSLVRSEGKEIFIPDPIPRTAPAQLGPSETEELARLRTLERNIKANEEYEQRRMHLHEAPVLSVKHSAGDDGYEHLTFRDLMP